MEKKYIIRMLGSKPSNTQYIYWDSVSRKWVEIHSCTKFDTESQALGESPRHGYFTVIPIYTAIK